MNDSGQSNGSFINLRVITIFAISRDGQWCPKIVVFEGKFAFLCGLCVFA